MQCILFSNKKICTSKPWRDMGTLSAHCWVKESVQKGYILYVPSTWHSRKGKTIQKMSRSEVAREWGEGKWGVTAWWVWAIFLGWQKKFWNYREVVACNIVNLQNVTELFTLNLLIFCHANFTSINWVLNTWRIILVSLPLCLTDIQQTFTHTPSCITHWYFLKKDCIYLFLERGEEREKGRERNISVWLPLVRHPHWGPGPQPRHVPWLGIKPATPWFTGRHSIHWAAPARAPVGTFATIYIRTGSLPVCPSLMSLKPSFTHEALCVTAHSSHCLSVIHILPLPAPA